MHDPKLVAKSRAAVAQAMQRLALESVESVNVNPETESTGRQTCAACGSANRKGNSFCASCGVPLLNEQEEAEPARRDSKPEPQAPGDHHYHHHYHHHYLSSAGGFEQAASPDLRMASGSAAAGRDVIRARAPMGGASLSRAEIALRKLTQDWALACNNKQLDDLIDLYVPDATVLRPNVPAVRGTAAIREFFFGLLDAGMSEVELEPLRAELFGDFGYEAGRCKSLVPSASGKRREERGKYLVLLNRQANGEWKIVADSWSSDLSLGGAAESPVKPGVAPGTSTGGPLRKP
jgi:ketosteroid isomerase-like protein